MLSIDNLESNSIVITTKDNLNKILEYINNNQLLLNIKFLSFADLKKGIMFDYTSEAINFVMKKYQVNYAISKEYITNLYYLEDKEYTDPKLTFLSDIKNELSENNLLIYDELFINLLKSKSKIYVYGFDYISKFNRYLLDLVKNYIPYEIINDDTNEYNHDVLEFNTIEDETSYVFEEISKLLEKKVNPSKIFIANYSSDYYFSFIRFIKQYNLPIALKRTTTLYDTVIGQKFISYLDLKKDVILWKLKKEFDTETNLINASVIDKITSLVNSYYWTDNLMDIKELIIEEMKTSSLPTPHFSEEINLVNIINHHFNDDEYVFLIGFNNQAIPKFKKDTDFIEDKLKPSFLETTNEYNTNLKNTFELVLRNIKNLLITYKLSTPFNSYSPSSLIGLKYLDVLKADSFISSYSNEYNQNLLTKKIDNLIKFNEQDENLNILYSNLDNVYNTYDNQFSGIDKNILFSLIDNKLNFSYSNISTYYKCPFRFYISNILNVKKNDYTLDSFIGTLFHHCLEVCLDGVVNIDEVYDKYIEDNIDKLSGTYKEKFFLNILKKEIHFVISTIKEQYEHSSHTEVKYEQLIEVEINRDIKTKIKGYIDKILMINNSAMVIDYKTNNSTFDRNYFELGMDLQLPIYLYLLKCLDNNLEVAGLYLQHILDLKNNYDPEKDAIDEKRKKLKLDGITINRIDLISLFDNSYDDSKVIKSLKAKDSEIKKGKNIITEEEKESLINLAENLIFNVIDSVSNGEFSIHPIKIGNKYDGCDYCEYKDICFRKPNNFNYQSKKDESGSEEHE